MAPLELDAVSRRALDRLAGDARRIFGDRFVSLVAARGSQAVVFAASILPADLDALGALTDTWHRDGLATPIVLTPDEFRRSLDAFPVEYQALLDAHVIIDGANPFDGLQVNEDDLRRACEAQARGHLIHLRQGWMESGAHGHKAGELIEHSAAPLRLVLATVARLHGRLASTDAELAQAAETIAGMPSDLVAAVLACAPGSHRGEALVPRLPDYLNASERLWAAVDRWRSR